MSSRQLYLQGSVALNAQGYGTVVFTPVNETWTINAVSVSVATKTLEARCNVYKGYVGPPYLVDATFTGSSGDTSDTVHDVNQAEQFIIEWTGGDVGALASVTVRGSAEFRDTGGFKAS